MAMSHLFKGRSDGCNDESPRGTSKNISTHKSRVTQSRCWLPLPVSRGPRFTQWATLSASSRGRRGEGGRERGKERHVQTPFPYFGRLRRTDVGARLKDFEGATIFRDRRGSLRRNKKGFNGTRLVRPLYYLSRCYPMNAQCIIWIMDKGLNFSRAPEKFCIFASYTTILNKEMIKRYLINPSLLHTCPKLFFFC